MEFLKGISCWLFLAPIGAFRVSVFWKIKRKTQVNFLIKNFGCTQHSSSKLDSVFVCAKFPLFLNFISARNVRTAVIVVLYIHRHCFCMWLNGLFSRWSRRFTQTRPQNNIKQTVFLCDIMQLCCIPLRDLRYLRENIHARVLNLSAQRNPNVSRRFRWFTQTKDRLIKWLC